MNELTRRLFLGTGIALTFATQSQAYLFSGNPAGAAPPPPGSLIKTIQIANNTGSTIAANSHTPSFGLMFKQGDVTSGTYPVLKTTGGTTIPYTCWNMTTWSDGSIKFLCCVARFPNSISGSSSADIEVYNGGSAPSAGSRTLSEVYAANIQVIADNGLDNISGDWVADLQAANVTETVVYGDGPAGKVWRLLVDFKQGGSAHGELVTYFYVMALQDNSGNLAGFRVLSRVTQPWYDVNSPTKDYRSFESIVLSYGPGPTTYNPISTAYAQKSFTWNGKLRRINVTGGGSGYATPPTVVFTGGSPSAGASAHANVSGGAVTEIILDDVGLGYQSLPSISFTGGGGSGATAVAVGYGEVTSTANGYDKGMGCRVSSSTSLPNGLSASTTYWVFNSTDTLVFLDGSQVGAIDQGANVVAINSVGSGTHTITPIAYVSYFCSYWIANTEGRYVYIQGGGSVSADPDTRIVADIDYDADAKVLPPIDTSIGTVTPNAPSNWRPYNVLDLAIYFGQTGERGDIGIFPSQSIQHFFNQSTVTEKHARTIGLAAGNMQGCFKDSTTKAYANISQTSYSGMPASADIYYARAGSPGTHGFTPPTTVFCQTQIFTSWDFSHQPNFAAYPYTAFGEPQLADLIYEEAIATSLAYGTRAKYTVGGVDYYNLGPAGKGSIREGAWFYRNLAWAASLLPDTNADPGANSDMLRDIAATNSEYMVAWYNSQSTWWKANGYFVNQLMQFNGRAPWQWGYLFQSTLLHANAENPDAVTMVGNLAKWCPYVQSYTGNLWCATAYFEVTGQTPGDNGVPYVDSDATWAPIADTNSYVSWVGATDTLTVNNLYWTLANDDKFIFNQGGLTGPGGISGMTPVYAVNVSGSTFKVALTKGGAPINLTDDGSNAGTYGIVPASPPSTGYGVGTSQIYNINLKACSQWAKALGVATSQTAVISEFTTRIGVHSYNGEDCRYAWKDSF